MTEGQVYCRSSLKEVPAGDFAPEQRPGGRWIVTLDDLKEVVIRDARPETDRML